MRCYAILRTCLPSFIGLLLQMGVAQAQSVPSQPTSAFWFSAGAGVGTSAAIRGEALAIRLDLAYQRVGNVFSARAAYAGDPIFGGFVYDVGLLYGRALAVGPYFASVAAGVARVDGAPGDGLCIAVGPAVGCSDGTSEELDATIGLPLEVQLYRSSRFVGVGLSGFANLNREANFAGVVLSVRIGRLR